jgi:predicted esterase
MTSQTISGVIPARTHGHYLFRRALASGPAPLLVGFHGYGENAETALARLESIPGVEEWNLCAIQALHLFYNRRTNEIVACWMTRLHREEALQDNLDYVSAVLDRIHADFSTQEPVVYQGFSQGVAMACRAAAYGRPSHGLLLLGGDIPPEIRSDAGVRLPAVLLARGAADTWYTEQKMTQDIEFLSARGIQSQELTCSSGHEWNDDFRRACGTFLQGLRPTAASDAGSAAKRSE